MPKRYIVEFDRDMPNDSVWEGDICVVPAGRKMLEIMRDGLVEAGGCCSEMYQHEDYGWATDVRLYEQDVFCLIQGGEPWIFLYRTKSRLFSSSRCHRREVALKIQKIIDTILAKDPKATHMEWRVE